MLKDNNIFFGDKSHGNLEAVSTRKIRARS